MTAERSGLSSGNAPEPDRHEADRQKESLPRIKICGIRTPEAVRKAAELGVDYIGLIFAPSKRQVNPEQAAELIGELKKRLDDHSTHPKIAGVFVDPTMEELTRTLSVVPLDIIQLHGRENPEFCREVREKMGVEVFKSISIGAEDESESHAQRAEKMSAAYEGAVDVLLLDTHDPLYGGGSGRTFNWEIVPLYLEAARNRRLKLFVAGGLTQHNVDELVRNYAPDGIDVSSGVETDGHKDIQKMTLFVERAVLS